MGLKDTDIDVAATTVTLPDACSVPFPIDAFARYCRVEGIDQFGLLQQQHATVERFENERP